MISITKMIILRRKKNMRIKIHENKRKRRKKKEIKQCYSWGGGDKLNISINEINIGNITFTVGPPQPPPPTPRLIKPNHVEISTANITLRIPFIQILWSQVRRTNISLGCVCLSLARPTSGLLRTFIIPFTGQTDTKADTKTDTHAPTTSTHTKGEKYIHV